MSHHVASYPGDEQYDQWTEDAEEMDMSMSEYVERMVEAGRTKIPITAHVVDSDYKLREQRNDLRNELRNARERIEALEARLHRDELGAVVEHIRENPGIDHAQLTNWVGSKAPSLTQQYVKDLRGELIEERDGGYYVMVNE